MLIPIQTLVEQHLVKWYSDFGWSPVKPSKILAMVEFAFGRLGTSASLSKRCLANKCQMHIISFYMCLNLSFILLLPINCSSLVRAVIKNSSIVFYLPSYASLLGSQFNRTAYDFMCSCVVVETIPNNQPMAN